MSCRKLLYSLGLITLLSPVLAAQGSVRSPSKSKPVAKAKRTSIPPLFDGEGRLIGAPIDGGGAGGKFGGRRGGRRRLRGKMTGLADSIANGLAWLQRHQDEDGGWNAAAFMRHDKKGKKSNAPGEGLGRVGITGFCLLAFLGEEAHLALDHLVKHQNKDGGFRYDGKGTRSDAFTTAHALLAYKSGLDFRIVTDRAPFDLVETWRTTTRKRAKAVDIAPISSGVRNEETEIAARLLVAFFLGREPRKELGMFQAADAIRKYPPTADKRAADPVFSYLATYALYQMGSQYWKGWSRELRATFVQTQRDDGNFAGSWDPVGRGVVFGGRLYATALSVLSIESFYRYTRLVR